MRRQLHEEKAAVWRKASCMKKRQLHDFQLYPMAFACPPWICYFTCICKSIITPPPMKETLWKYLGIRFVGCEWLCVASSYLHVGMITVAFTIKPWPLRNPHNHVHKKVATDTTPFELFEISVCKSVTMWASEKTKVKMSGIWLDSIFFATAAESCNNLRETQHQEDSKL